jgi:hypothetical protein
MARATTSLDDCCGLQPSTRWARLASRANGPLRSTARSAPKGSAPDRRANSELANKAQRGTRTTVEELQGLGRPPYGRDGRPVAADAAGHPVIGVGTQDGADPEHDGGGCGPAQSFGGQLVLGVGALGVGPGLVVLDQRRRIVRPRSVHRS